VLAIGTWSVQAGVVTYVDGSCLGRVIRVFSGVCVFVCLFLSVFPDDMSKTDAAGITKLGIEMFHHNFWKPIYFRVKGQGHTAQKTAGVGHGTLVSADVF